MISSGAAGVPKAGYIGTITPPSVNGPLVVGRRALAEPVEGRMLNPQ